MIKIWVRVAWLMTIGLCMIGAANSTPPTAEDFIPQFSQFTISPNGEYIAVLRPVDGRNALMVQSLDNPHDITTIPSGPDTYILDYRWYNDELLLMNVGWGTSLRRTARPEDVNGLRALSIRLTETSVMIQDLGTWFLGAITDDLSNDRSRVLVNYVDYQSANYVSHAAELNVYTGGTRRVSRGRSGWNGHFVTDTRGRVRVLVDGDQDTDRVWMQNLGSVDWNLVHESPRRSAAAMNPWKVLENGRFLYLFSAHEGRVGLYKMDMEAPGTLERVYLHDEYDLTNFVWSDQGGRPLYVTFVADTLEYHFFDDGARSRHERINRLLPGGNEYVVSSDDANNRHIVYSSGPGEAPVYYLLDEEAHSINELAIGYPQLPQEEMAHVEAFSYHARDGLEIPAYLAVPPHIGEAPYPLIVWPHGGPHYVRESQEFDGLRQFLATRGYAVFAPNFRGSWGYGNEFASAGLREWGGAMQDDITDGVQHLIDQGTVDPSRICIVGWSYGAYASMIGLVQTPELYQCGIAINGVYDLRAVQRELGRNFQYGLQDWWRYSMGRDADDLARVSPARHADRIHAPVLILHSEEDRTIPEGQHDLMVDAMRHAGVEYQEHVFEEGDHSMNFGPSMIETYQLVEEFLAEHLQ